MYLVRPKMLSRGKPLLKYFPWELFSFQDIEFVFAKEVSLLQRNRHYTGHHINYCLYFLFLEKISGWFRDIFVVKFTNAHTLISQRLKGIESYCHSCQNELLLPMLHWSLGWTPRVVAVSMLFHEAPFQISQVISC